MSRVSLKTAGRAAMVGLVLALAAPATRGQDDPRAKVLELNKFTGTRPMLGILHELKDNPEQAKTLVQAGLALHEQKKLQYNAALILAHVAADLKDLGASEKFFRHCAQDAAKLSSTNKLVESYGGLIELFNDNKKYPEAARVCQELLKLKLDDGKKREYYLAQKADFGDGVDFFPLDEFDAVFPLRGGLHRQLAKTMAKQGKYEQALQVLDSSLRERDDWQDLETKAAVLSDMGRFTEAAKAYEDTLPRIKKDKYLKPKEREVYVFRNRYLLSHVYVDLKQIDKATEHLEALMTERPNDPGLHNDLGYIWADHDMRLEDAEKLIRKALELDRERRKGIPELQNLENGAYLDSLAWVLFKQKKYKEAKDILLKAVEDKDTQHIEIYDHLGDVHMALEEREAAVAAWRKGLDVAGDSRRDAELRTRVEKKVAKHAK